jgi:hypothetical protein
MTVSEHSMLIRLVKNNSRTPAFEEARRIPRLTLAA